MPASIIKVDDASLLSDIQTPAVERAPARVCRSRELEPGDVIDGFQIVRVVARCGMGSVFKAHDRATGAAVVLKIPHMSFESDVVFYSRFQREERIGLRLRHPLIARVIAVAEKSRPYIVVEHVEGPSLWHLVRSEGRMSAERATAIGKQLCEALAHMHSQGVVHRDIKPENVLIDSAGTPRIVDFGIALDYRDRRLTWGHLSSRLGTPEYMAPEQMRGRRGDARVDVYALGATLYEILAGAPPFPPGSVRDLVRLKLHHEPRPLTEVAPDIDPALAGVVMRAIARDPRDRFSSALDMLGALSDPRRASATAMPVPVRPSLTGIRAALLGVAFVGVAWLVFHIVQAHT
jgi:serine/threonine-protein kinase